MPYAATDGPPTTDATHSWAPASGPAPPIINNQNSVWPPALPRIKLDRINGWRTTPESQDLRDARTFGIGEILYPSRKLGKTVVYECRAQSVDLVGINRAMHEVLQGFGNDMDAEGTMTVTPFTAFGGVVWTFNARCLVVEPDPSWDYNPGRYAQYQWGFSVSLRMSDPRFYTGGIGYV